VGVNDAMGNGRGRVISRERWLKWDRASKPGRNFGPYFVRNEASLVAQIVKNLPAMQETWVQSLGQEDPLKKDMATHPSVFAWRIPWTEEPGGLQSLGSQKSQSRLSD